VFKTNHNFNEWQTGLTFLGIFVGMVVGVSLDPLWRKNYMRLVRNNGGVSEPVSLQMHSSPSTSLTGRRSSVYRRPSCTSRRATEPFAKWLCDTVEARRTRTY